MAETLAAHAPISYAFGDTDWQKILTHKHKLFFSMYVHVEPGLTSDCFYQNNGFVAEEVVGVMFRMDGSRVAEIPPVTAYLKPDEALTIAAADLLAKAGYTSFRGEFSHRWNDLITRRHPILPMTAVCLIPARHAMMTGLR